MKAFKMMPLALTAYIALSGPPALAQWAVVDTGAITQLLKQIEEMKKQYDMLKKQYQQAVAIKDNLQGNYGMGLLENGVKAAEGRRPLPKTWKEVVDMQKSGQLPGLFAGKKDFYKDLLPTIDSKLISKNSQDPDLVGYELSTDNTRAAFAAIETVYNNIEDRMKTVESLTAQIEKTPNQKAATDLNSRIVAETNFINLEMMRVNSMQLALQASMQNVQNQATAKNAEFFSKPGAGGASNSIQGK